MRPNPMSTQTHSYAETLEINRVLKNTYLLLSLTLVFSAATAFFSMTHNVAPIGIFGFLIGWFGLYFVTAALRNSPWGLLAIFAFTGFAGYTLGPILNQYIQGFSNGGQLVGMALGTTGVMFLSLSGYALSTRKDFSYMGGFIAVSALAAFVLGLGSIFFQWTVLSLLVSFAFTVISAAFILYNTSMIINGGERNYLMAAIGLYIAIFNIFINLLRLFAVLAGNRD